MDVSKQQIDDGVLVEGEEYRRVTLYVPLRVVEGIKKAAARDSRPLDHIFNVALYDFCKRRKFL